MINRCMKLSLIGQLICINAMASMEEEKRELPFIKSGSLMEHLSAMGHSPRAVAVRPERRHSDPMEKVIDHTREGLEEVVLADFYRVCALDLAGLEQFANPLHIEKSFRSFQGDDSEQTTDAEAGPLDASQVIACQEETINTLFLQVRQLESFSQSLYAENQVLLYRLDKLERERLASPRAPSSRQTSPSKTIKTVPIASSVAIPTSPREMVELAAHMCQKIGGGASPKVSPRGGLSPTGTTRVSPASAVFGVSTSPRSPVKARARPVVPPLNLREHIPTISPRSSSTPKTLMPDGSSSPATNSPSE